MSHAILRGRPTASQLYLDGVLKSVLNNKEVEDPNVISISELIWCCMKENLSSMYMINGSTGESFTNEEILKMSVPLSRALMNKGLKGEIVMMVLQNHQSMVAVYYGALFAGAIPFLVDSKNTMYEFSHFIALVCPSVIFCEESCSGDIIKVVNQWVGERPDIVIASSSTYLKQYTTGFSGDLDSFRVADVDLELPAVVLPTSGSTGLPKAAMLGHRGLVAQLPTLWTHHDQFPRPTDLVMLVSTSQWMTHTSVLTTCPVYQITLLMTPSPSVDGFLAMILQYKPTWTLLGPMFADTLAGTASSSDFTSFQTILTTGAQPTPMAMKTLKDKLSHNVHLCNGYGMTETHGFTTMPDIKTPYQSCGRIVNIFDYKLLHFNPGYK